MASIIIKTTDSWKESVVSSFEQNGFEQYRPGGINTIGFLYLGRRFKFKILVNKKRRFSISEKSPKWIDDYIKAHGMECHIDVDGIKEKYNTLQEKLRDLHNIKRVMQFKSDMMIPYITESLMKNPNISNIRKLDGCNLKDFAIAFSISLGTEHSMAQEMLNDREWISERVRIYNDSGDNINLMEPLSMNCYLEIAQKTYNELSDNDLDNTPFHVSMHFNTHLYGLETPRYNFSDKLVTILEKIDMMAEQLRKPDSKISEDIKWKYDLYVGLRKNDLHNTTRFGHYVNYINDNLGYIGGVSG